MSKVGQNAVAMLSAILNIYLTEKGFQRMHSERLANAHRSFTESLNKCSANARRMLSECSPSIVLHSHFHANKLAATAFGECLANVQRMHGDY